MLHWKSIKTGTLSQTFSSTMDSEQIERILRNRLGERFCGVFASDKLPKIPRLGLYVVNLDPSELPGSHWVAIYIHGRFAEYFDSYGLRPFVPDILNFLTPFHLNHNSVQIQSFHSDICGEYCCLYAASKCLGHTLRKFLSQFHHSIPRLNDCRAVLLFQHAFPEMAERRQRCHPRAQQCCSRMNKERQRGRKEFITG